MSKGINKRSEKILLYIIESSLKDALYHHRSFRIGHKFDFANIRARACRILDEIDKACDVRRRRGFRSGRVSTENTIKENERQNKRFGDAEIRQLIRSATNSTKSPKQPKHH